MPSIQELTVEYTDSQPAGVSFLEELTPTAADPPPILPNLTALSVGDMVAKTFRIRTFLKLIEARAKYCRRIEFWGLMMNIHVDRPSGFTKLIPTSSSCVEMQRLRDAGLKIRLLESNQLFQQALFTDPYSIQRCGNYNGITTPKLWDDVNTVFKHIIMG
jgi:hypothetical protein